MDRNVITQRKPKSARWWLFLLLLVLLQFVPPYTSKGVDWQEIGWVTGEILSRSLVYLIPMVYPIFKIAPIVLIGFMVYLGNRITRLFSIYVGITYVLFAFLQSIAVTERYGLGVITINLIMFLIVAISWFWEAGVQRNNLTPRRQPLWRYWVIPFAFLAFWYPVNPTSLMPDFNPVHLFANMAGLTFCMMTPLYLAVLALYYPTINIATLRVTSLVGTIIGFYNMWVGLLISPSLLWWNALLHIPLLTLSVYGLALSLRRT